MKQFEVTFIVDPVLSGDELKSTVNTYNDMLKAEGCKIVVLTEMGLRQLAYDINKRSTGVYYTIEFQSESGEIISKLELALRRDERIMRFLTVRLDKFGIKYNEDKRAGKIGKVKEKAKNDAKEGDSQPSGSTYKPRSAAAPAPATVAKPEPEVAPIETKVVETVETPKSIMTDTDNADIAADNTNNSEENV